MPACWPRPWRCPLTACGGADSSDPNPDASAPDASSTPAADGAITIKVGGIGPLTGSNATYGVATDYGAQVAVAEINALDSNIKLEYRFEDDTGVNETGVSAYNTLKDTRSRVDLRHHHHRPLRGRGRRDLRRPVLPADPPPPPPPT